MEAPSLPLSESSKSGEFTKASLMNATSRILEKYSINKINRYKLLALSLVILTSLYLTSKVLAGANHKTDLDVSLYCEPRLGNSSSIFVAVRNNGPESITAADTEFVDLRITANNGLLHYNSQIAPSIPISFTNLVKDNTFIYSLNWTNTVTRTTVIKADVKLKYGPNGNLEGDDPNKLNNSGECKINEQTYLPIINK